LDNEIIKYRKVSEKDKEWIESFIKSSWGSDLIVVHYDIYYPRELKGFIAELNGQKAGLVTYKIKNEVCEIITLNSIIENKGIGSELVKLVIEEAKIGNCKKVCLTTTNDNSRAINFYRKLGFYISAIRKNAVAGSRRIKPEIPFRNENGIPINDEIEFTISLR